MAGLRTNNSFYSNGLRSERDKFGIEQELDRIRSGARQAYSRPDSSLYRSASMGGMGSGINATSNTVNTGGNPSPDEVYENYRKQVNNWYGAGNKASLDDLATRAWNTNGFDINTTPYANWSNYGSGNIFKDDFKLNETNDTVRGYYGNTKSLADSEYDAYKRLAEDIARQSDAITSQNQLAYIAKQQQLKNAREQNMSMGRGGLGTSEAGYNRINTAYENQRNAAIKSGNEIADDTVQAYNDFIKATRVQAGNYENAARDSHGDYIVDGVYRYLNGDDSGGEIGMLNALSNKQIKYNNGTEDVTIGSYIDTAEEQRLKDYVNKAKTDNAYFYGGDGKKDADTIFQQYYDLIEAQGSKNQPYQDYLKYDAEQKEKAEMVKPENFAKRGALANVANSVKSTGVNEKEINYNGNRYHCTLTGLSVQNRLDNLYNLAVDGDIVEENYKTYLKVGRYWFSMNKPAW